MKICFPTEDLRGLESTVYGHFGSAPGFVIVDSESRNVEEIANNDLHHSQGMCQPLKAFGGREIDAVGVGGIGRGALSKLHALGIKVYLVTNGTVGQNVVRIINGELPEFQADFSCPGHAGGTCAH